MKISDHHQDIGEQDVIELCEERLALSASLPSDLLLEALSIGLSDDPLDPTAAVNSDLSSPPEPADASQVTDAELATPNLIEQAAEIRSQSSTGNSVLNGSGQTVAVIDSGVAWDHVALGSGFGPGYRVVGGWDFAENDDNPYDDGPAGFHGTHVAGLLAGESDSFSGVAPGADIVALRVFDDDGMGQLSWIEDSLQWVHDNQHAFESPITTVNLSVGAALNADNLADAMSMLEDELQLLRDDGILVFAAAGNFFGNSVTDTSLMYPAASDAVVAVGSVNDLGDLSSFSQRADGLLATSGESVHSSVPDHVYGWDGQVNDFASLNGTSMATPQIAAASMLVRQSMIDEGVEPTPDAILARLRESTVTRIDAETGASYSVIDLQAAVKIAASDPVTDASEPNGPNDPIEPNGPAENDPDEQGEQTEFEITHFTGTSDNESFVLDLTDGIELRSGGNIYRFDATDSLTTPIVIDVGAGADSLHIIGSDEAERLVMYPSAGSEASRLSTNTFAIEFRGVESVVFDGGGGSDRATLYDSSGDDTLRSGPDKTELSGVGFQFEINQVSRIYVHATAGGDDHAFLNDSVGDDTLAVRPQFTSLRNETSFQAAYGFERVYAYATAGGNDTATLYDSDGDDTMSVSPSRSIISGPGYQVSARGFESVDAYASGGGNDTVNIYADDANSQWDQTSDRLQWTGSDGATRIARGFERMQAFEQYEPIAIAPQSLNFASMILGDDADERLRRERQASQAVFEWLGSEKVSDTLLGE
ncbi:Peptidase S8 and S53, subtilisin, kexin, sedolisin domain protein [Rhodopirellula maiorica SM1]|uniref:Peptidase S8 and S53, subtilisin, kexin, sedolisin domain protein n=1 Tax=Rhodopirellula maiorica SM1 TaxID=1265738 RepID=M5RR79_9BACT|nr:S8 family serine peptidase [Rhodopirellula maiorica]EMI16474.1 Peptidase S8 and S53, subtilisin, kexin, sedolisin domain protein [Rhodopirellula maiorica SM1]